MSRTNPFGDLDDFAPAPKPKPVPAAINQLAETNGFPSRKAQRPVDTGAAAGEAASPPPPTRAPRRRTTGRNRQINIKATEEAIERLYRIADALDLPLGAVLERALDALERETAPENAGS